MPPKAKITRDMIIDAGLSIIRSEGPDSLNVRRVAAELSCSTQPVMYHFRAVNELKAAVYEAANRIHTQYIMPDDITADNQFLSLGLRYIRFAAEEKNLFRFLFQSGQLNISFSDIMYADDIADMINPLCEIAGLTPEQAGEVFEVLFMCVHGAAGLIANNSIEYDEAHFERLLMSAFYGAVSSAKGDKDESVQKE